MSLSNLTIAQIVVVRDGGGPSVVAKSPEVPFAWENAALAVAAKFGPRPAGVACPEAVFAVPFARGYVAVVQVADRPGPGQPLGFRFLILTASLYDVLGDPFDIAAKFPPDWSLRGTLDSLQWPPDPLPQRTVADVLGLLKSGDSPLLLGTAQGLLDGSRLLLVRPAPDAETIAAIWKLLPTRSRGEVFPASFAFCNDLGFHAVALPAAPSPWPLGYLTEDQVRDYPEGRYELALQIAAENGDQAELDRLFARRSSKDTLRLALAMVAFALAAAVLSKLL